jgi:hypothetical protein
MEAEIIDFLFFCQTLTVRFQYRLVSKKRRILVYTEIVGRRKAWRTTGQVWSYSLYESDAPVMP